jgi:hypothetical protein
MIARVSADSLADIHERPSPFARPCSHDRPPGASVDEHVYLSWQQHTLRVVKKDANVGKKLSKVL